MHHWVWQFWWSHFCAGKHLLYFSELVFEIRACVFREFWKHIMWNNHSGRQYTWSEPTITTPHHPLTNAFAYLSNVRSGHIKDAGKRCWRPILCPRRAHSGTRKTRSRACAAGWRHPSFLNGTVTGAVSLFSCKFGATSSLGAWRLPRRATSPLSSLLSGWNEACPCSGTGCCLCNKPVPVIAVTAQRSRLCVPSCP